MRSYLAVWVAKNLKKHFQIIHREWLFVTVNGATKQSKTLVFVVERSMSQEHIINEVYETYKQSLSDEFRGYPPNCKPGYVEKDGKCVPKPDKNSDHMKE